MVGPNGLEPSTSSVSGRRSNQLSYGPTCERFWVQFYGQRAIPATFASPQVCGITGWRILLFLSKRMESIVGSDKIGRLISTVSRFA